MRATALQPPPPTPITLIRVPVRASSSISYFKSSISTSPWMMPMVTSLLQHSSDPGCIFPSQPGMFLQLRRIHRQSRGGTPRGIVQFERPILNAFGQAEARLALQDFLRGIAQTGQFGAGAGEEDAADERVFHADAGQFAAYEAEQLFGAGAENAVDHRALHLARLAIFGGRQFHQDILPGVLLQGAAEFHFHRSEEHTSELQ